MILNTGMFDSTIIVPQHISRHAFCSAQFILFDSLLAFVLEYHILSCNLFLLYVSTMLHWNCVRRMTVIKIVDIILTVSSVSRMTFIDIVRFTPYYQTVWNVHVFIAIVMFVVNETLFYYQVTNSENRDKTNNHFHYFSLKYTMPNSPAREMAYYRNVYTHMFFLHVMIPGSCAICACRSLMYNYHNNLSA